MKNREVLLMILAIDMLLLNLCFVLVANVHYDLTYTNFGIIRITFFLLNISWVFTFLFFISDNPLARAPFLVKLKSHSIKFFFFLSIASILALGFNITGISRFTFFSTIAYFYFLRLLANQLILRFLTIKKGRRYNYTRNLIVGAGKSGEQVNSFFENNTEYGEVIGFLDDHKKSTPRRPILGTISDFQAVYEKHLFNQVIITIPVVNKSKIRKLIDLAEYNGVRPRVVPDYYELFSRTFEMEKLGDIPIVNIREFPLDKYANRFWKRVFDVVFSIVVLIITFPLLLLIAIAIKLESKGPVFYKPVRLGRRGEKFTLFKFRSMFHSDNPDLGTKSTTEGDPRITRVGRFIRKYSLDEFPQFINVIKHDMSVVGPRPHRISLNKILQEKTSNYLVRHYVYPGITGWAQVNGWRGPTESKLQSKGRTLYDLWYIEHWTFLFDMYIIFLTIFSKKVRKNAY